MKIKRILKNIIRDSLRFILPKLWYIKIRFYLTHGYKLNLDNPKTWNEKIQYRKLNCDNEYLSKFVDKLTVREYVKEIIGEEYLIPLLEYYEKITPEDLEKLPNAFVIKTSNGGGGENVKVINDKSKEDFNDICKRFNRELNSKAAMQSDELAYTIQKPHIIIEKLILDENGEIPSDYKFQVFNQKDKIDFYIQVDKGRFTNHQRSYFDSDFNKIDLKVQPKYKFIDKKLVKPKNYEEMVEVVEKLSKDFSYVRIDIYNIDGKIYFGEFTFCHGSGWEKIEPQEWDYKMGKLWELKK